MATTVYVCEGKHCRGRPKRRKALVAKLEKIAQVADCTCMKICCGPVAGLEVDGRMEWFEKLDSDGALEGMRKLVKKGKLNKALKKRQQDKRTGDKPRGVKK